MARKVHVYENIFD